MLEKSRKVAVFTGSRSEYGLLEPLIERINHDFTLQLIVSGSHLSPHFGYTASEITYPYTKVEMLIGNDSEVACVKSMGVELQGLADVYDRLKPDLLVVLGDRYETFIAAAAAVPFRIPIAHIHGGERTGGSVDDKWRWAITEMAALHFVSCIMYRDILYQHAVDEDRVFNVGALAVEGMGAVEDSEPIDQYMVLFHPTTANPEEDQQYLKALKQLVFETDAWRGICNSDPGWGFYKGSGALKRPDFLRALKASKALIGNSSAGIYEAPYLGVPSINIGSRQRGRLMPDSVLQCDNIGKLPQLLKDIETNEYRAILKNQVYPFGDGTASKKIIQHIKEYLWNPSS
jgi:UDP-N-acetylglucosamine 2-epimerase